MAVRSTVDGHLQAVVVRRPKRLDAMVADSELLVYVE